MELKYKGHETWIIEAKKALAFLIQSMGENEWEKRRAAVVAYFNSIPNLLPNKNHTTESARSRKPYAPYAMYDDWMAWYMYLVESLVDRPACDEPMQSARIYPFFSTIGRHIEDLKSIGGINDRIETLLNKKRNQPDACLYEIVVALTYIRNGWKVDFIPETPGQKKNPDFKISRDSDHFFVECKRLAKSTEYTEKERLTWNKHYRKLFESIERIGKPVHVEVNYSVPVDSIPEDTLGGLYLDLVKKGLSNNAPSASQAGIEIKIFPINMEKVNQHMSKFFVRHPSPQLITLLTGDYIPYGGYTNTFKVIEY